MAQKKLISEGYRDFIGSKPCCVCGARPVDIHHESLSERFSGQIKKYNDFQAVPLCHSCHLEGRHTQGWDFWRTAQVNPFDVAKELLSEYYEALSEVDFDTADAYNLEVDNIEYTYGIVQRHEGTFIL